MRGEKLADGWFYMQEPEKVGIGGNPFLLAYLLHRFCYHIHMFVNYLHWLVIALIDIRSCMDFVRFVCTAPAGRGGVIVLWLAF